MKKAKPVRRYGYKELSISFRVYDVPVHLEKALQREILNYRRKMRKDLKEKLFHEL